MVAGVEVIVLRILFGFGPVEFGFFVRSMGCVLYLGGVPFLFALLGLGVVSFASEL